MNNKFKSIADIALSKVSSSRTLSDGQLERTWRPDAFNAVFAQLIVQECIRIAQDTSTEIFNMSKKEGDIFEYQSHGAEAAADAIKEYFGIEE